MGLGEGGVWGGEVGGRGRQPVPSLPQNRYLVHLAPLPPPLEPDPRLCPSRPKNQERRALVAPPINAHPSVCDVDSNKQVPSPDLAVSICGDAMWRRCEARRAVQSLDHDEHSIRGEIVKPWTP